MSAIWQVQSSRCEAAVPATTVAALLDVVSSPASADTLLRAVQSLVPVDYLLLVRIHGDLPEMIEGSATRPQESAVISRCFSIYRRGYYRRDALLPLASRLAGRSTADVLTLHCRADELPDPGWRSDIYEQEHLTDRFTLLHAPAAGSAHAINLYRDDRQGGFRPQEIDRLLGLAPLLCRAHASWWARNAADQDREDRIGSHERRLQKIAPALSARERAVCARIAEGLSADGIAADLDVAPSTVSTLRKRAYQKLADTGLAANRQGLARLLG